MTAEKFNNATAAVNSLFSRRRTRLFVLVSLVIFILVLMQGTLSYHTRVARHLSAKELMSRPLPTDYHNVPKLFHQSWKTNELPEAMAAWSQTCRNAHPDWEWVMWTNEDNLELVKRYFPSFLHAYNSMDNDIYRADVVRNMYMFLFGGVYADLDFECLRPLDSLFREYNVSSTKNPFHKVMKPKHQESGRKAFFGRMGVDEGFDQSIPNAWMASSPSHPFFLLPLEFMDEQTRTSRPSMRPEELSGPKALYDQIYRYNKEFSGGAGDLDAHFASSSMMVPHGAKPELAHSVEILPFRYIYPYSWQRDGTAFREVCSSEADSFDAKRCKKILATEHWGSYMITYWRHSWG